MSSEHLMADIPCKALIKKDGKYLFVQEPDGYWAIPGGRLNVGELPRDAVKREVQEELGVEVTVGDLIDCSVFTSKNGLPHFVVVFAAELVDPAASFVFDPKEVVETRWLPGSEAASIKLRNEYLEIVKRLCASPLEA